MKQLISLLFLLLIINCSGNKELLVSEFNNSQITLEEFEEQYSKNAGSIKEAKLDSLTEYENFLDLYVNYKLKLKDAEERNLENDPEIIKEIDDYKRKVGSTFLLEKELIEPKLKEFYKKWQSEIRVSHILLRPDSTGMEGAKRLADSLMSLLNKGKDFSVLVQDFSQDPFSKPENGDIYYITAGQVTPDFEVPAFNTKPGTIYPEPVQTRFGYHIIKVTEKQPRRYELRARHLLIDFNDSNNKPDTVAAFNFISQLKDSIVNGADFEDLAKKYSEDKVSGEKGGDLGFFKRRMMVKEFDKAVFELQVGELSDIVKTQFGFHLIQLLEEKPIPSFEEEKDNLRKIYEKTYYKYDYDDFIDSLKNEFNYTENSENIEKVLNVIDGTVVQDYFDSKIQMDVRDKELFSINSIKFFPDSVFSFMVEKKQKLRSVTKDFFRENLNEIAAKKLIEEKAMLLDSTNTEFAKLMNEYKNGIIIFKLQEEEVWNNLKLDSLKMMEYYNKNKENYIWPNRAAFTEFYQNKEEDILKFKEEIDKGADFDSLIAKHSQRTSGKNKDGKYDLTSVESNQLAAEAYKLNIGEYSEPMKSGRGWVLIRLDDKVPATMKTYEEAKAEVASKLQEMETDRLEKTYISRLREKYKPIINKDVLQFAFKERTDK